MNKNEIKDKAAQAASSAFGRWMDRFADKPIFKVALVRRFRAVFGKVDLKDGADKLRGKK
jgi:hypothetical protein